MNDVKAHSHGQSLLRLSTDNMTSDDTRHRKPSRAVRRGKLELFSLYVTNDPRLYFLVAHCRHDNVLRTRISCKHGKRNCTDTVITTVIEIF